MCYEKNNTQEFLFCVLKRERIRRKRLGRKKEVEISRIMLEFSFFYSALWEWLRVYFFFFHLSSIADNAEIFLFIIFHFHRLFLVLYLCFFFFSTWRGFRVQRNLWVSISFWSLLAYSLRDILLRVQIIINA